MTGHCAFIVSLSPFLCLDIEELFKRSVKGRRGGGGVDHDSAWNYKARFDLTCAKASVLGIVSHT